MIGMIVIIEVKLIIGFFIVVIIRLVVMLLLNCRKFIKEEVVLVICGNGVRLFVKFVGSMNVSVKMNKLIGNMIVMIVGCNSRVDVYRIVYVIVISFRLKGISLWVFMCFRRWLVIMVLVMKELDWSIIVRLNLDGDKLIL